MFQGRISDDFSLCFLDRSYNNARRIWANAVFGDHKFVQLLDYKTGRPLRGRCVALAPSGKEGKYFRQEVLKHRTDKAGEVEFHVRAEAAPKVIVTPLNDYSCAKYDQFTTADILDGG